MLVVPAAAMAGATAGTTEAVIAPDQEAAMAAQLAAERQAQGRVPLSVEADLVEVARNHSATMAAQSRLYHNPLLGQQVQGWLVVAENVGLGQTVAQVHTALMASPQHRSDILDPRFDGVGVGVVQAGASLWVTEVFRQRAGQVEAPAPAPAPAPARTAPPPPRPVTTTTVATTTTTSTTTTTTTAPPPPPLPPPAPAVEPAPVPVPAVELGPVAAASVTPLPDVSRLVDTGLVAAAMLWAVVAGLTRTVAQLHGRRS